MHHARALVLLGLLLVSAAAAAADHPVLGKQLVVRQFASGTAVGQRVEVRGRETASPDPVRGDPASTGAAVTVFAHGAVSSERTFVVPGSAAGGRWETKTASDGALVVARYRDAAGAHGFVQRIELTKTAGGTLNVSAVVEGIGMGIVPPDPGTDGGMILTFVDADRVCVGLGGAAGGTIANREGRHGARTFRITGADTEIPCPVPTTTSTTTTTTSTSLPSCGSSAFPTCSGWCASGSVCQAHRLLDIGTDACACVPADGTCSRPYPGPIPPWWCDPVCPLLYSGPCPAGQVCVATQDPASLEGTGVVGCTALPLCLDGPWPVCGGQCPDGGSCQAVDIDFGWPEHFVRCLCPAATSPCSCEATLLGIGVCPAGQVCVLVIRDAGICTAAACI